MRSDRNVPRPTTGPGGPPASLRRATGWPSYASSTSPPAARDTPTRRPRCVGCSGSTFRVCSPDGKDGRPPPARGPHRRRARVYGATPPRSARGPHRRRASIPRVIRVLLVTNDFPPRPGVILSYLAELVRRLANTGAHRMTVYAPQWKGTDAFDDSARSVGYRVIRHPGTLMLPGIAVDARMRRLIAEQAIDTVWLGAAAPLALLAQRAREGGAARVLASTHGHEVGWSMLPVARSVLRRIGTGADVVTCVSRYTRGRFASAFGPTAALEHLPPGVDTDRFRPDPAGRAELRARYRLGQRPTVVCVSRLVPRKGQDMLIRALPSIRRRVDGAALVIVGGGPYLDGLRRLAQRCGVVEHVTFTGGASTA